VYFSPDIVGIIGSRSRRWAGHAARMGRKRNAFGVCFKHLKERFCLEYLGMDGWMDNIKCIFCKCSGRNGLNMLAQDRYQ